jgi:hypothetical protein
MKDETYMFHQDSREKKNIARSARNKRTHTGKRGGVKLPSDYMTEKEKKQMNGEVKTYKLNDPIKWAEFKSMPDDLKIAYIKAIWERYNAPDTYIAQMLGVNRTTLTREVARLGIKNGKAIWGRQEWDKAGFLAWSGCEPVPTTDPVEVPQAEKSEPEQHKEPVAYPMVEIPPVSETKAIPVSGSMTFEGSVADVLNSIHGLLGGANVHISITWDTLPDNGGVING